MTGRFLGAWLCAVGMRGGGGTFSGKRGSGSWRVGLVESSSERPSAARRKVSDWPPPLRLLISDRVSLETGTRGFCGGNDGGGCGRVAERTGRVRFPTSKDVGLSFS